MSEIVIYTKSGCMWCVRAKDLLINRKIPFTSVHMPMDISREDLLEKFPEAHTMPIITIDDKWIGGFTDLESRVLNNEIS